MPRVAKCVAKGVIAITEISNGRLYKGMYVALVCADDGKYLSQMPKVGILAKYHIAFQLSVHRSGFTQSLL